MPSKKEEFSFPGQTAGQLLEFAYGTFLELGWTPKFAGPNAIVAYTPRSWNKNEVEIVIKATDGIMTVQSSLVNNEAFDLQGRNQKHINKFIAEFEKVKLSESQPAWAYEIERLREQTTVAVAEESKQAGEIDKVMKRGGSKMYVTYTLIAINIIVFILMIIDGAGIFKPNGMVHMRWGSNYSLLTLTGDWWRLITCVFIHFGIIHLVFNCYSLYVLGMFLEPMLGKPKFIVAYLTTGIFASLTSLWWHTEGANSAGASGAIFGLDGVFLALLLTNLIPKQIRIPLLQNTAIFIVFNLVYGTQAQVDNAAHVGGLLSGVVIGFIYYLLLKKETNGLKNWLALLTISIATVASAYLYLNSPGNQKSPEDRRSMLFFLEVSKSSDGELYLEKYDEFVAAEEKYVPMLKDRKIGFLGIVTKYDKDIISAFDKAELAIATMKSLNVSEKAKQKTDLFEQLLKLRKEEYSIIKQLAAGENEETIQKLINIDNMQGNKLVEINESQ